MNLLIVESPEKAKTIKKYLGDNWEVAASVGHIRDLKKSGFSFDRENYIPEYELTERGKDVVKKLKALVSKADEVWLAPDLDREGEAIAWHLKEALRLSEYKRVAFNEVTESAIKEAIKNPRLINMEKVNAQQGRRLLDRLIGYAVSPHVSEAASEKMAAGRCQSPAVKLVVENEEVIRNFKSTKHFGVRANFKGWFAEWDTTEHVDEQYPYFTSHDLVKKIAENKEYTVLNWKKRESKRQAPAPLITSTLQQAASVKLKINSSATMKAAQTLYEKGLITYMRTDYPNLSDEAIKMIKDMASGDELEEYLSEKPNTWKAKEGAQEAHEAIRPTDFNKKTVASGDSTADKLYELIWQRAVGSQCKPAKYTVVETFLETPAIEGFMEPLKFKGVGKSLSYKGWLAVTSVDEEEEQDIEDNAISELSPGDNIASEENKILEKKTAPPKRFTEAALIKKLESSGIGRPSTYANIMSSITKHGFVVEKNRVFHPTLKAEKLISLLNGKFSFVEYEYTNQMEKELDRIACGMASYQDLLRITDSNLKEELDSIEIEYKHHCTCGRGLKKLKGKSTFWGCTGFSSGECKNTFQDDNGEPYIPPERPEHFCPECDNPLVRIKGNNNSFFWGCTGYAKGCEFTTGDEDKKPAQVHECPNCEKGRLRKAHDKKKKAYVWICTNYKKGCKDKHSDKKGRPQIREKAGAA